MFANMAKQIPPARKTRLISKKSHPKQTKRKQKDFINTKLNKGKGKELFSGETAGYTKRKERIHSAVIVDSDGTKLTVTEQEEAGKYTPKRTVTNFEYLDTANVLQIGKTNPRTMKKIEEKKDLLKNKTLTKERKEKIEKDLKKLEEKKIVSSTMVQIQNPQAFLLKGEFLAWDKIKDPKQKTLSKREKGSRLNFAELRILAQDLDVPSAGITQSTLEGRIRKKLAEEKKKEKPVVGGEFQGKKVALTKNDLKKEPQKEKTQSKKTKVFDPPGTGLPNASFAPIMHKTSKKFSSPSEEFQFFKGFDGKVRLIGIRTEEGKNIDGKYTKKQIMEKLNINDKFTIDYGNESS